MPIKKARRRAVDASLNINSMMDMMTIILVFLLKSYSTSDISVAPSDTLTLPVSSSDKRPEISVNLVVAKDWISVDGKAIVALTTVPDDQDPTGERIAVPEDALRGPLIPELRDELEEKADALQATADRVGRPDQGFKGRVTLQADKELPYEVLRQVMYTAGQAKYGEFRFVVYQQG